MGPNGPIGLNLQSVHLAMDEYKVPEEERVDFSLTVRNIANIILSAQAEQARKEADRLKNK